MWEDNVVPLWFVSFVIGFVIGYFLGYMKGRYDA